MNKLEKNNFKVLESGIYPHMLRWAALFLVFFCVTHIAVAQKTEKKKSKKRTPTFTIKANLKSSYDNNILKYSEKYLERFMNLEDEGRFNIKTYDDIIFSPSLKLSAKYSFIKKRPTQVNFYMKNNSYLMNNIKNWNYFSITLEQYYHKKGRIGFKYDYIPEFYIRHYRDDDYTDFMGYITASFKPMSFSKENYSLYLQHYYKKSGAKIALNYTRYFYNVHFIEYDSKEPNVQIILYQSLLKNKLKLSASCSYKLSNAKGVDEYGESIDSSDDANASFFDYSFTASAKYKFPKLFEKNNNISIYAFAGKKYFTTTNYVEYDMLHAGRNDFNYKLRFTYNMFFSKSFSASVFYNRYGRITSSLSEINAESVASEKNYSQYQAGFSIAYNFRIKTNKK